MEPSVLRDGQEIYMLASPTICVCRHLLLLSSSIWRRLHVPPSWTLDTPTICYMTICYMPLMTAKMMP